MKKWVRRLSYLFLLLFAAVVGLANCVSFSMKREKADALLAATGERPQHGYVTADTRKIHYVTMGDPSKPMVLFVHGSPGSWDAFIGFLAEPQLLKEAYLVSVDRPGFGESGRGKHEPSLAQQARDIAPILDKNRSGMPALLVGHSYGGPVIAQLALDHPDKVRGLVFVAGSIDPDQEKTKWYQIPANWMLLSWMVPKDLRTANREILPLKGELEKLIPRWPELKQPTIVIQGEEDTLVPPENAAFARRMITHAPIEIRMVAGMGHFIPWSRPKLIKDAIQDLLPSKEAKASLQAPITGETH